MIPSSPLRRAPATFISTLVARLFRQTEEAEHRGSGDLVSIQYHDGPWRELLNRPGCVGVGSLINTGSEQHQLELKDRQRSQCI